MSEQLSSKQQAIYDFIKESLRLKGYPPAIREIGEAVGLNSTSSVHAQLNKLEKKGYIRRPALKKRCLEVLEEDFYAGSREMVSIPIIGKVTAGEPILAVENIDDYFVIPLEFIKAAEPFMLRVKGDSMIGAGILDGDLVIIRKQNTAENGDIVVALIGDSATIKTFYKEKGYFRLQPENPDYKPIIVRELRILGVIAGLYRKY